MNLKDLNPNSAPEESKLARTNIGKVLANDIITVREAAEKYGWKKHVDNLDHLYWDLEIENVDFNLKNSETGEVFAPRIFSGNRLQDKNGRQLDKRQRPALIQGWFSDLGINVFPDPDDPDYDASEVVGRFFKFEMIEPAQKDKKGKPLGRDIPKVVEAYDEDFSYTKPPRVHEFTPDKNKNGGNPSRETATAKSVELTEDAEARAKFIEVLADVDLSDENAVDEALRSNGLRNCKINGEKIGGLLVNETFAEAAQPLFGGIIDSKGN